MTDEEVIKRRLLIDGDGTGDDRRLNVLQKSIIKWCGTNESEEDSRLTLDRMLAQLSQCEYTVQKSRQVAAMSSMELENYKNLSTKIKQEIDNEKKTIESTKKALQEARTVRRNKMEYDILGKVINEQPDRKQTGEKLKTLQTELKELDECMNMLDRKMTARRHQFNALIVTIHQLQHTLEDNVPLEDKEDMEVAEIHNDSLNKIKL